MEQLKAQITKQVATQTYAQDKFQALRQDFQVEKVERNGLEVLAKQVLVLQGLVKDLTIHAQHMPQRQCARHEREIEQLKRQLTVHLVQVASPMDRAETSRQAADKEIGKQVGSLEE
ncbi:hypothetical protein UY3_07535 [Chelonia mydas]|uniref:Uncharacterized protein n=1 Tax=Chelonia mydas TaxID=8469 RepID=M7BT65_CHEMY|nr:hypothetical protein UY3_07535 [Chelonia mydas]